MTRLLLTLASAACAAVVPILGVDAAHAERRVALVIGNSDYQNAPRLDNPMNDATAMADLFRKGGFDVVTAKTDLGILEFKRSVREFVNTVRDSDIAVIYYAGHGIEVSGINYMVPVDAKLASDLDAEDEAVDLDRLVRTLDPARRLRLVILDACRDNPFVRKMQRTVATRAVSRGLAKIEPTGTDTLIAYAAKAGSSAEDGTDRHSPFTTALLNHLLEPGLDVRIALGRVRDEVLKKTGNRQEPFVYGSLGGTTVTLAPAPEPKTIEPTAADVRSDYQMAERVGTIEAWDSFLALHGSGFYADLARAQRQKLVGAAPEAPASEQRKAIAALAPAKPAEPAAPRTADRVAWEKIQDTSDLAALRNFIKRFPNSPLALTAQHRLELLEQAAAQRRQEELERLKAEREAARQREQEEQRAKAIELERQKSEREAARQREQEERRAKAIELQRQKAEQDAARRREQEEKQAKLAPAEPEKAPPPKAPAVNTPELIRSAQGELRRIGCYAGQDTGSLDASTRRAVDDYRVRTGQPKIEVKITDELVVELEQQPELENCIAALPKPTKPAARAPEKRKEPVAERPKPKPEPKREARPARQPQPKAKAQAAPARPAARATVGGGGMVGVGF
jgi:hypothetical protein